MEQRQRASELAARLRRLLGPTEPGPQRSAPAHWDTMPRWNEPAKEFTRADEPATHAKIRAMADQPAVQLNMNVGSAADGKIKGIDGLLLEIDPQGAIETFDRLTRSGDAPTLRTVASEMLPGRRETKEQLLNGPPWAGSKRGWVEPGEAATAVINASQGRASQVWTHVERPNIEGRAKGEDYDEYLHDLADERISPEEDDDERYRNEAVEGAEMALHKAFRPTVIHPTAKVDPEAVIGDGVRIDANAKIGKRAHIGDFATVGESTNIKRDTWVAAEATIGHDTTIAEWARVGSVGNNAKVGQDAYCRGTIGDGTRIGTKAHVKRVGDSCSIGARSGISADVGNEVSIGKDSGVGSGKDRYSPDDGRPTLQIPDKSDIGEHVHAPFGWRQTSDAVHVSDGTSIGKDMSIPSETRIEGTLDTPKNLAELLETLEAPIKRGQNCEIEASATLGAGCRIGDDVRIEANAEIMAGAEIGAGSHIGQEAKVGIAASVGPKNTISDGNSVGDGARTGQGCLVGPEARIEPKVTTGDYNQVHGLLMTGARTGTSVTISTNAVVGPRAQIGDKTTIAPDATIGAGCRLGGGVEVGEGAKVGRGCEIKHGVRIGAGVKLDDHQMVLRNDVIRNGRPDLSEKSARHPAAAPQAAAGTRGGHNGNKPGTKTVGVKNSHGRRVASERRSQLPGPRRRVIQVPPNLPTAGL